MRSILLFSLLISATGWSQITFSEHIAPIVFDHCVSCHRPGEIGPMPLTNYSEVASQGTMIEYVTDIRYMPPWRPDHTYSTFRDENWLTDEEISMISEWVSNGMPEGNPALTPPLPVFPEGSQVGVPDLVLTMEQPYLHLGTNTDQYQIFVLPTGLTEDRDIEAIEVRPDNKDICHHAILGVDVSGIAAQLDAQDPEYGYTQFGGFGFDPEDQFFSAWVPGASPMVFPPTLGKLLPAGSDLLLQMHYGPSSIDQEDQTSINIFFADDPVIRYVQTYAVNPTNLEELFIIPPSEVTAFHGTYTVPLNVSVIGVAPHAHLLGKSFELYATSPDNNDTIPLIHIPEWNFNWQGFFAYPNLTLVPAGYTIHYIGEYDNTLANPFNPNNPPQWSSWGEGTEDEMYLCYIQWVPYLPGDQDIVLSAENAEHMMSYPETQLFPSYPNPATDQFTVGFSLARPEKVTLRVLDTQGKLIQQALNEVSYPMGRHKVTLPLDGLASGTYVYQMIAGGEVFSRRFIVTH